MAFEGGVFIDVLTRLNMASVDRVLKDVKALMKEAGTTSGDSFTTSFDSSVAAGAKGAFDPLVAESDAAFRQMQIGMADLQQAEARINDLRARSYASTTDQMIAAQKQLDGAIANSQRLIADAAKTNAVYRDSFMPVPAVGERGTPAERTPSTGNNRSVATREGAVAGDSTRIGDMTTGAAIMGAGDLVGREQQAATVQDRAQDAVKDVISDRFTHHIESGTGAGVRVAGLASILGLTGAAGYGVRADARIQNNLARLQSLQGESPANMAAITPAVWNQAVSTGFNTNDISNLYPAVESATNPLTGGRYRGQDAINVVDNALKLARVSNIDPKDALQGLTTTMFNYKMGPSGSTGAANMIAQGLAGFKGSATDYFEAQHSIEPVAEQAGIKAPEIFAGLDVASQSGQSAQQSAQNFANLIKNLARPTGMMSSALQQLGLNPEDLSTQLSQNGIAGTLTPILQAISAKQFGPNGSVVLGALAEKPLMQQQQAQIADQLSPQARQYMESDDFQKSLVSGFSARKVLEKAGSQNFSASDMPLLQTWLQDQQRIMGASDVLKRNQADEENPFGAFSDAIGGKDAARIAIMLGGSPQALDAYKKRQGELADAQNNPNAFNQSFQDAMKPDVQKWHQLGQDLGRVSGQLGNDLLPTLATVTDKFKGLLDFLDQHKTAEQALIDAMLGLAGIWVAQKTGLTSLVKGTYNLGKAGINKLRGGGGSEEEGAATGAAAGAADESLQAAAETLDTAANTLEAAAPTFETGATTFETAAATFGEAVPVFADSTKIFADGAKFFADGAGPFETGASALDTAAGTLEKNVGALSDAAAQLDGSAKALDEAAGAIGEAGLRPPGLPGEPAPGEEPVPVGGSGLGRNLGKVGLGALLAPSIADAISGHDTTSIIDNALHGRNENGQPMPFTPSTPSLPNDNPAHSSDGGLIDLGRIPKSQGGMGPEIPGHSRGGIIGYADGTSGISQPLMGQPDTGGDSLLGLLPGGQAVGLRGGEGILTPEAVAALGGEDAVNALNDPSATKNPWSNPGKVASTFYSSFAKGVAKYSPWGKYLVANSQSLSDLEKEQERADKEQKQATKRTTSDMMSYLKDLYGSTGSKRSYSYGARRYGAGSSVGGGNPAVMHAIGMAAAEMGLDQSQYDDVKWIFSRESGFDPGISNGGGHGAPSNNKAYGLGQFLGHMGDKYGAMGAYSGDPGQETKAAIQYMIDRYGSPAGAKAYWETHGNYAHGGIVTGDIPYYAPDPNEPGSDRIAPGLWPKPHEPFPIPGSPYGKGKRNFPDWWQDVIDSPGDSVPWWMMPGGTDPHLGIGGAEPGSPWEHGDFKPPPYAKGGIVGFAGGGILPLDIPKPPPPSPNGGGAQVVANPNPPQNLHVVPPQQYGTNNLPGMPGFGPKAPRSDKGGHHASKGKGSSDIRGLTDDIVSLIPGGTAPSGDRNIQDNPSQQLQAEGKGFGVGGGILGMAEGAASTFASAFGGGQATQAAFNLVNRAIGYGGQLLGIGMKGLIETFLPNDSPAADPSKNIFGKIALGIAGAHPGGNNMAASHAKPLDTKKDLDKGAMQAKQSPGIHIENIHNHSGDHSETFGAINKAVNFANHSGWNAGN